MKLVASIRQGLFAGPALGATVGLLDCLRAAAEGGTVLTPDHWLTATAMYAAFWTPLGLLAGLVGGLFFRHRGPRAAVLFAVLGTAAFAYGAYENIVNLPAFTSPESLRFDAILLGVTGGAFLLLYLLPVPVPEPRARRWLALAVIPLGIAGLAGLFAGGADHDDVAVSRAEGKRPNVLIYLVDTLRADHLSAYGYSRKTSPRFDALVPEGALFTNCRVNSTWTKPATASILTGLAPTAHGAIEHRQILPDEAITLAEVLRSAGYDTAAFSDNPFVSPEFGFGQGFDAYDYREPSVFVNGTLLGKALWTLRVISLGGRVVGDKLALDRGSPELCRRALDWIGKRPEGKPWFAYIHAMEPHLPYDPPSPFRGTFADKAYDGPDHDRPPPYIGFLPFEKGTSLPDVEREHLVARYDEEILAWDAAFGDLVDDLSERGLLDDTILVVLSDHGEEFMEHGGWTHGHSLYEELLHVPFWIRGPGVPAGRIDVATRGTDVFPTLVTLTGHRIEAAPRFGADLAPLIRGEEPGRHPPVTAEVRIGGVWADSVVAGDRKLVRAVRGTEEVTLTFDLKADPGELSPLESPDWQAGLIRTLEAARKAAELNALDAPEREITDEEAEALKGLGY
jgi:arylsulfatase A-like enzyme